jgi:hypothetical protein
MQEDVYRRHVEDISRLFRLLKISPEMLGINPQMHEAISRITPQEQSLGSEVRIEVAPDDEVSRFGFGKSFSHTFFADADGVSGSRILLPQSTVDQTSERVGQHRVDRITESLELLLKIGNHDFTMHQGGIFGGNSTIEHAKKIVDIDDLYPNNPRRPGSKIDASHIEQLAVAFHTEALRRIFILRPEFKTFITKLLERALNDICELPIELQKKWTPVLRYLSNTILDPNDPDIEPLRLTYKDFFISNEWSNIVQRDSFELRPEFVEKVIHADPTLLPLAEHDNPIFAIRTSDLFDALYLHGEYEQTSKETLTGIDTRVAQHSYVVYKNFTRG